MNLAHPCLSCLILLKVVLYAFRVSFPLQYSTEQGGSFPLQYNTEQGGIGRGESRKVKTFFQRDASLYFCHDCSFFPHSFISYLLICVLPHLLLFSAAFMLFQQHSTNFTHTNLIVPFPLNLAGFIHQPILKELDQFKCP